jgi:LPPG:FO 2-phospho-L-lactate transferase
VIVVLSGGVGAARLLRALRSVNDPSTVMAIVNVGDDLVMHGLSICPDLDTITYTLAELNNDELGWGLAGESWRVMAELEALGGESWFSLGDRDLATHLYRTQRLSQGATKSDVAHELSTHFGVPEKIQPISDDPIRTMFDTEIGPLSFQEYFVRHHHGVEVRSLTFEGADVAQPAPGILDAIAGADRILIAPSNPLISIAPILAVRGVAETLRERREDVVAISPIIQGSALKGPADRLMRELGHEASCVGVARYYHDVAATMVIDELDRDRRDEIVRLGMQVRVTTTVMSDEAHAQALATEVLA